MKTEDSKHQDKNARRTHSIFYLRKGRSMAELREQFNQTL